MKLAEALIQRADAQKRAEQLRARLIRSAKVQEGEDPPEDPRELLAQLDTVVADLTRLIQQINRTNASVRFDDQRTLTDVLAERDTMMLKRSVLSSLIEAARPQMRYGLAEIKELPTVNVGAMQRQLDDLAREYRELDTAIQQMNWTVDLIEEQE